MSYKDAIECPHCHKTVDLDIEIEGDDGYMNLYPIVIPKKGVVDCLIKDKVNHGEQLKGGESNGAVNMER